jgi:hypothetical protein
MEQRVRTNAKALREVFGAIAESDRGGNRGTFTGDQSLAQRLVNPYLDSERT